jgi:hypothetical protein
MLAAWGACWSTGSRSVRAEPWETAARVDSGIRLLEGARLILYTDLPPQSRVDELPAVFDRACQLWAVYFGVDPGRLATWRVRGCLMQEASRFRRAGLLPADLPPFAQGFQQDDAIWWHEQPTEYYRRHLLLHEGAHAFMRQLVGGVGPPWYMEGMAELLATHSWDGATLSLRSPPGKKQTTPGWGRVDFLQAQVAAGRARTLTEVFGYGTEDFDNGRDAYAWCWAACALLDAHPVTRARFRALRDAVGLPEPEFTRQFLASLRGDWIQVQHAWWLALRQMDYGYRIGKDRIVYRDSGELPSPYGRISIDSAAGWQSTGYRLQAGLCYRLEAVGRYRLRREPEIWWSEPQGVTVEYLQGRPLGALLAVVLADEPLPEPPFPMPVLVGRRGDLACRHAGTLYLRINETAGALDDNQGQIHVSVRQVDCRSQAGRD